MILHSYFAKRFVRVFLATLFIFLAFLVLIDLIEQMRRFGHLDVSLAKVFELTLLNAPAGLYQILPLVMILSSVSLFLSLARSSELVVARASGRSAMSMLLAPVLVSALIGAAAVALFNPIVAATSKRALQLEHDYKNTASSTVSIGREGLWLREGDEHGQTVIHARQSSAQFTVLFDVSFVKFNTQGAPQTRIIARSAALREFGWQLKNVKSWDLSGADNPEKTAQSDDILVLATTLTQESIRDSFSAPLVVPIWQLPQYISQLHEAGFSPRRHEVWLQMELARPLFLIAMLLVGAGFTMRHTRFGKTGLSVLSAVLLGFGLYYVRNFAQILGENGQLPTLIAAWTPPVASILLALGLLLHMEDG